MYPLCVIILYKIEKMELSLEWYWNSKYMNESNVKVSY